MSKNTKLSITLGSDPELCLFDNDAGKIVSSMPVLGRLKDDPIPLGNGARMYADNVLVEMAFKPIAIEGDVAAHFRDVLVRAHEKLGRRYSLLPKASHVYEDADLRHVLKDKEGHPITAFDVGCNPQFHVYRREVMQPQPFKDNTRSSSMHIHLGNAAFKRGKDGRLLTEESRDNAVRVMDIIVGCASTLFDRDPTSQARRELGYGFAGCFRPTGYGAEWRVLSSYALQTPSLVELVRDLTAYAMSFMEGDSHRDLIAAVDENEVQAAINVADATLARKILKVASLPSHLMKRVTAHYETPALAAAWRI